MKTSNNNISEVKLFVLYNRLEIKYVKLIVPESNKIRWIMYTLKIKYNITILEKYINNKLNAIISLVKKLIIIFLLNMILMKMIEFKNKPI